MKRSALICVLAMLLLAGFAIAQGEAGGESFV
jgi:hypothetical protein